MPIVEEGPGRFVLRCVNYHGPEYMGPVLISRDAAGYYPPPKTTMDAVAGRTVVPLTSWIQSGDEIMPRHRLDPDIGVPVQLYMCRICGYVEIYSRPAPER